MQIDIGTRTSTNAGVAGGLVLFVMWLGNYFAPELMASAPPGTEAILTAVAMWGVARISKTGSEDSLI